MTSAKSNLNSNLKLDIKSNINTDGRTDGQNEDQLAANLHEQAVDAHARTEESDAAVSIGAVIKAGFLPIAERYPVRRAGERDPISWALRRAVSRRDGWCCRLCGFKGHLDMELDHVRPWSAGGPDEGWNLRLLCQSCNERRSNFDDGSWRIKLMPVTWWCIDCYSGDRIVYRPKEMDIPTPWWVDPDSSSLTFAYCATCDGNSYAEVVL